MKIFRKMEEKKRLELRNIKNLVEKNSGIEDISKNVKTKNIPLYRGMFCIIASEIREPRYFPAWLIGETIGIKHSAVLYWRRTFKSILYAHPDIEYIYKFTLQEAKMLTQHITMLPTEVIDQDAVEIIESMMR